MAWDKGYPKYEKCTKCKGKGRRYEREAFTEVGSYKDCVCEGGKVEKVEERDIDSIYERNHNK